MMTSDDIPNLADLTQEDIDILKQELNVKEVELCIPTGDGGYMVITC